MTEYCFNDSNDYNNRSEDSGIYPEHLELIRLNQHLNQLYRQESDYCRNNKADYAWQNADISLLGDTVLDLNKASAKNCGYS